MNERIKALASLAGYNNIFDNDTKARERLEKFAELIVRDAANIYFQHAVQSITREQDVAIAVVIKDHFGVK